MIVRCSITRNARRCRLRLSWPIPNNISIIDTRKFCDWRKPLPISSKSLMRKKPNFVTRKNKSYGRRLKWKNSIVRAASKSTINVRQLLILEAKELGRYAIYHPEIRLEANMFLKQYIGGFARYAQYCRIQKFGTDRLFRFIGGRIRNKLNLRWIS
jgi:hypothetical protein